MDKFEIGDEVQQPGIPLVVEVLEIAECGAVTGDGLCTIVGREVFRFADPETGEDDWMHSDEFVKVG